MPEHWHSRATHWAGVKLKLTNRKAFVSYFCIIYFSVLHQTHKHVLCQKDSLCLQPPKITRQMRQIQDPVGRIYIRVKPSESERLMEACRFERGKIFTRLMEQFYFNWQGIFLSTLQCTTQKEKKSSSSLCWILKFGFKTEFISLPHEICVWTSNQQWENKHIKNSKTAWKLAFYKWLPRLWCMNSISLF